MTLRLAHCVFIISLMVLVCGCSSYKGVTPGTIPAAVLPDAAQQGSAAAIANGFIEENNYTKLSKSSGEYQKASRVANKLLAAAGYKSGSFPVAVVDAQDEVNAMVLNGSSIIVYKKLIDKTSETELATVMAHEVGHLLGKHNALHEEEERRAGTVSVLSSVLGSVANVATSVAGYGGVSGLAGDVTAEVTGAVGYGAYVGSFSRDQEYEADHIGLMLMAKAGYDPKTAIAFWTRSKEVFESDSSSIEAFFSTHPASANRAEALAEYLPLAEALYHQKKGK